ncbi:MAG: zf-HC2 domain-containing protein [Anaerolineales bacterium]|nr:zf-HC2 domain-containing protein [Anaerolineales bacterium]
MNHEPCRHLLESLSDYVDGTLGGELCSELERHLEGCENCRVVVDSLRKTIYLYQVTAMQPSVPEDVRQRLYRRLDIDEFMSRK